MGISGLLPFLQEASKPCHISEFRGATCVVDVYCWLHKGAHACAVQLAQGEDTHIYVDYCLKYVKMLQSYNIRPILVFDGKNLPAKAGTEAKRKESRNNAKQRAAELLRIGKTDEARSYLKQCINITPNMASAVIKECHKINVDCIVAPYESDAQLAFFNLRDIAEVVITEDSDLLLFGCSKVMFKLDLRGCGYLVDACKIPEAMKLRPDKYTFDKFRYMCILSGCDYIDSLRGIGLKKAQKFMSLTEETDPEIFLDKLPRYLNMRHLQITNEYKENFMVADATFRHQIVFDPFEKKLVPLIDPAVCGTNPKYCKNAGEIFDHEKAYQIALGNLHPTTFQQLDSWSPSKTGCTTNSIWSGVYQRSISRKEQKVQFKEFFKVEKKAAEIVEVVDEQVKIEEDMKISKELEFYSHKILTSQENSGSEIKEDIPESPVKTESTSPILKKNPFLVKTKLSKFHYTDTDSKIIVKSRYFASSSEEIPEKLQLQDSMDIQDSEVADVENISCNAYTKTRSQREETEGNKEIQTYTEKHICDDIVDLVVDEKNDIAYEMKAETVEQTADVKEFCYSQKSTAESSNTKRKKLGPCRSVGLKRSKSVGQQTIQYFFGNFKKE